MFDGAQDLGNDKKAFFHRAIPQGILHIIYMLYIIVSIWYKIVFY